MRAGSQLRHLIERFLSFGEYPGESITQRGRRRIIVGYAWVGAVITIGPVVHDYSAGRPIVAILNLGVVVVAIARLVTMEITIAGWCILQPETLESNMCSISKSLHTLMD